MYRHEWSKGARWHNHYLVLLLVVYNRVVMYWLHRCCLCVACYRRKCVVGPAFGHLRDFDYAVSHHLWSWNKKANKLITASMLSSPCLTCPTHQTELVQERDNSSRGLPMIGWNTRFIAPFLLGLTYTARFWHPRNCPDFLLSRNL